MHAEVEGSWVKLQERGLRLKRDALATLQSPGHMCGPWPQALCPTQIGQTKTKRADNQRCMMRRDHKAQNNRRTSSGSYLFVFFLATVA